MQLASEQANEPASEQAVPSLEISYFSLFKHGSKPGGQIDETSSTETAGLRNFFVYLCFGRLQDDTTVKRESVGFYYLSLIIFIFIAHLDCFIPSDLFFLLQSIRILISILVKRVAGERKREEMKRQGGVLLFGDFWNGNYHCVYDRISSFLVYALFYFFHSPSFSSVGHI